MDPKRGYMITKNSKIIPKQLGAIKMKISAQEGFNRLVELNELKKEIVASEIVEKVFSFLQPIISIFPFKKTVQMDFCTVSGKSFLFGLPTASSSVPISVSANIANPYPPGCCLHLA
ncbi:hypothetical protein [Heyndrickxia coagulans]|uniref:hypothetical protein n=1 Tax=Heyndrickxia coagulans TaxID=1398 RepID=UPI0011546C38|nr:hypothetical protein [Heyndrickxia coagulans]